MVQATDKVPLITSLRWRSAPDESSPLVMRGLRNLSFLWHAAHSVYGLSPALAGHYLRQFFNIADDLDIDLNESIRSRICGHCFSLMIPGVTCISRLQTASRKSLSQSSSDGGKKRRRRGARGRLSISESLTVSGSQARGLVCGALTRTCLFCEWSEPVCPLFEADSSTLLSTDSSVKSLSISVPLPNISTAKKRKKKKISQLSGGMAVSFQSPTPTKSAGNLSFNAGDRTETPSNLKHFLSQFSSPQCSKSPSPTTPKSKKI